MSGADILRRAVRLFEVCRESFNDRFSAEELIKIYRAYSACSWDKLPDTWTEGQIQDALRDIYPQWNEKEQAIIGCPIFRTFWVDEKSHRYTDESSFRVETAKGRGKYSVRYSFTGKESRNALDHFHAINIGNGYKKRLRLDGKTIMRSE